MKAATFLSIAIFLIVFSNIANADWVSPTGTNDPSNWWDGDAKLYDDNTKSFASSIYLTRGGDTHYIEVTLTSPIPSNKVRIWANELQPATGGSLTVDVYYDNSWHNIYTGCVYTSGCGINGLTWDEINLGGTYSVSKARFKAVFGPKTSGEYRVYEFDFWQVPPPPVVTNSIGASNITTNSARLNGDVTNTGGENPTVHIYWGDNNGGTSPVNWDHDENLGIKGTGTFYKDISGLSPSTTYYYRTYATNSGGSDWADNTVSFITSTSNQAPTISSVSDSPDPVTAGNTIIFTVNWLDPNAGDLTKIHLCKTDAVAISGQTCTGGGWCDTGSWSATSPSSCNYSTSNSNIGTNNYYAFVCDDENACSSSAAGTFEAVSPSIPVQEKECQGYVKLVLEPAFASPSAYVEPSVYGLSSCNGKTVYFKQDSCSDSQKSSCVMADDECIGNSFIVPSVSGPYTYYACVDKNGDSDFADSGESSSLVYLVGYSSLPEFDWTGVIQIIVFSVIVLLIRKTRE